MSPIFIIPSDGSFFFLHWKIIFQLFTPQVTLWKHFSLDDCFQESDWFFA